MIELSGNIEAVQRSKGDGDAVDLVVVATKPHAIPPGCQSLRFEACLTEVQAQKFRVGDLVKISIERRNENA